MNMEGLKRQTPDALGRWYGRYDARRHLRRDPFGRCCDCIEAQVLVASYSARRGFCRGYALAMEKGKGKGARV
jgi:hypothetical protein